ncbi:MAG: fibronectin type III domain-containing protein [Clostridiales bacterium]|nr:fibronectin type III domain-containing protein [Clostridiales bacterium]
MKKRLGCKLLSILTCVLIVSTFGAAVFAGENDNQDPDVQISNEEVQGEDEDITATEEVTTENTDEDSEDSYVIAEETITEEDTEVTDETIPEEPQDEQDDTEEPEIIPIELYAEKSIIPDDIFADDYSVKVSPKYGAVNTAYGMYNYQFNAVDAATYEILSQKISDVANGRLRNTEFVIDIEDLGFDDTFTAEELGIDYIIKDGQQYPDLGNAILDTVACELEPMLHRLLAENPYDFCWFNKTVRTGVRFGNTSMSLEKRNGVYYVIWDGSLIYYYPVSVDYAVDKDATHVTYVIDPTEIQRAMTAAAYAQQIVDENAGRSDLSKLAKYKEIICDLNTYNDYAADKTNHVPYGDPWNLVYVFDQNPNTNVVCEGYSKAFKYLCDLSTFENIDFTCITATGNFQSSSTNGAHMWNIVSFGENMNYMVDITNCDEGSIANPDLLFLRNVDNGNASNTYIFKLNIYGSSYWLYYTYDSDTINLYNINALTLRYDAMVDSPAPHTSASCSGITLTWNPREGAASYDVYRRTYLSMWDKVANVDDPTYTDTSVVAGTDYWYSIVCKNSDGYGMNTLDIVVNATGVAHTPVVDPAVPPTCTTSGKTEGSHCSGCGKILVYQRTVQPTGHTVAADAPVAPTETSSGLTAGTHCSKCGEVLIPQYIVPSLKTDDFLTVTVSNKAIDLSWKSLIGATGYQVYKRTPTSEWQLLTTTTDLYYTDTDMNFNEFAQYYCVLGLGSNNQPYAALESDAFCSFIHISTQPGNYSGPIGSTAYFNVDAYGADLKYQWQINKGYGWQNTSISGNKSKTLTVGVLSSRNGFKFRCIITDLYGKSVITNEVTMHVTQSLSIKSQPLDCIGFKGETAVFSVEAEGADLKYQWQINKGSGWQNTTISGCKTDILSVGIMTSRDGFKFRCIVTDSYGNSVISNEAELSVAQQICINTQPIDFSGPKGDIAVYTVNASGDSLSYQWQINKGSGWINTSFTGNKTSTLLVEIMNSRNGFKFRCIITDIYGVSMISNEVTLLICDSLSIIEQPEDFSGFKGDIATFNVKATGDGLIYQWQINKGTGWQNTSLTGNKTQSLSVDVMNSRDGFKFRCIIINAKGQKLISDEAVLYVI